jgi:hypothetical protein
MRQQLNKRRIHMKKVSTLTILILLLSHLMAEATELMNVTVDYQDAAGYVTLQAHKEVYSTPSGGSYYINSIVYSWALIQVLSPNTDYMADARIGGTADRGSQGIPDAPVPGNIYYWADYSGYAAWNRTRVSWVKWPWINQKKSLYLSAGGSQYTWSSSPSENPFDPYAEVYGDGDPQEVVGGSIDTDNPN